MLIIRIVLFVFVSLALLSCGGGGSDSSSITTLDTSTDTLNTNEEPNVTNEDDVSVLIPTSTNPEPVVLTPEELIKTFDTPQDKSYETPPSFPSFE